jgi:hypothetical protein
MFKHDRDMSRPLSVALSIYPSLKYEIIGEIRGTSKKQVQKSFPFPNVYDRDENCSADRPFDRTFCVDEGWTRIGVQGPIETTKGGKSFFKATTTQGARCVQVSAQIVGKGTVKVGPLKVNCNGRGWLGYNITLIGQQERDEPIKPWPFKLLTDKGERSVVIGYRGGDEPMITPKWDYTATIRVLLGGVVTKTVTVTASSPNVDGFITRIDQTGQLSIIFE